MSWLRASAKMLATGYIAEPISGQRAAWYHDPQIMHYRQPVTNGQTARLP
jgi:hypothetical protein